ncbi:hypothetical protein HZH68_005396 [Vespula germanica]|uniref:Uncharacterized protein n=1 Tax=Vespula germanica TaxID=30212 RepID=A0A834KG68_VESGE|nr:hypothetical protein HZH68_005396 [Vespula germanica]
MQQCPDRAGTGLCRLQRHQGLQWSGSKTIKRGPHLLAVPARNTFETGTQRAWYYYDSVLTTEPVQQCTIVQRDWTREH